MDPVRRKLSSFLTEAARKGIKTLEPQSPCAKELNGIEDVDTIIAEEIEKICNAATLAEITKILFLSRWMKKTSGQKRETIKSQLKKIAEEVVTRAESQVGHLTLPQTCRHLLLEL
jgi:hypothetical protein